MLVWHIDPTKGEIRERDIHPDDAAANGVREFVFLRRNPSWLRPVKGEYTKTVVSVLFASQPELFSVPLEQAFVVQLAKALMSPPKPSSPFSFLSLIIGLVVGFGIAFLLLRR